MKGTPLVSIILKTWNGIVWTKLFLESLNRFTNVSHELIVVDNGSTDGTIELLQELKNAKLILNPQNRGCIFANIQGIEQSQGRYLCLVDNDIVVSQNWLDTLVAEMQCHSTPPIGIVAPLQLSKTLVHPYLPNLSIRDVWDQLTRSGNYKGDPKAMLDAFCYPFEYDQFVRDFLLKNRSSSSFLECPPEFVGGSCILVDKNILNQLGGFLHLANGLYGGDDVEICWRFGQAGYKVVRTAKTYVHHFKHSSVTENNLDRNFHNWQSCEVLFAHWKDELVKILLHKLSLGQNIIGIRSSFLMLDQFVEWLDPAELNSILEQGKISRGDKI